jgi:hypothetical protein
MKFEKTIPFINSRLDFVERVIENKEVTIASELEWEEAKVNLTGVQSMLTKYVNDGDVSWDSYSLEIAYFEKFVNDCISQLLMAIELYETIYKGEDLTQKNEYNESLIFLQDLQDVKEEAMIFIMFNEEQI